MGSETTLPKKLKKSQSGDGKKSRSASMKKSKSKKKLCDASSVDDDTTIATASLTQTEDDLQTVQSSKSKNVVVVDTSSMKKREKKSKKKDAKSCDDSEAPGDHKHRLSTGSMSQKVADLVSDTISTNDAGDSGLSSLTPNSLDSLSTKKKKDSSDKSVKSSKSKSSKKHHKKDKEDLAGWELLSQWRSDDSVSATESSKKSSSKKKKSKSHDKDGSSVTESIKTEPGQRLPAWQLREKVKSSRTKDHVHVEKKKVDESKRGLRRNKSMVERPKSTRAPKRGKSREFGSIREVRMVQPMSTLDLRDLLEMRDVDKNDIQDVAPPVKAYELEDPVQASIPTLFTAANDFSPIKKSAKLKITSLGGAKHLKRTKEGIYYYSND